MMQHRSAVLAFAALLLTHIGVRAQYRLPDTGQTTHFATAFGEDADYTINAPAYTPLGNGTVRDDVTGLIWQVMDGGEMTYARARTYADTLALGGHDDWRLPTMHEAYAILHHGRSKPAMDAGIFVTSTAEYWWTSDLRADDPARVWVTNAGGGIGAHLMTETISAGGTRRIHVRCVRGATVPASTPRDQGDGTFIDPRTGLQWRTSAAGDTLAWEDALAWCENAVFAGYGDWRLPNVKELQSLAPAARARPCFEPGGVAGSEHRVFWTSTTLVNQPQRAWTLDNDFGLVSYTDKTARLSVLSVRGGTDADTAAAPRLRIIPGGTFEMGDHFGFVDPSHPSDEVPLHTVRLDSFRIAATETATDEYLAFLNNAYSAGTLDIRGGIVYRRGSQDVYCYTREYASYASITFNGAGFAITDFRARHPMVGVMWTGAAAYCNWLSAREGRSLCYDTAGWTCDFTRDGYRLPTEAEWEYAGRGGHLQPYFVYPHGNEIDVTRANLPASGDPYETGDAPFTTPVGFYDGTLKQKSAYGWPGPAATYQTTDGANGFGLYDMQGNVWEFVNDWYGQNYYSSSPVDNPKGPMSGFIMPDGKPYRGMRGGNWYNGLTSNRVNDGHSRVANRNPSYYRGPQDPNHPWYHIGFRVASNASGTTTGILRDSDAGARGYQLSQNFPNPFDGATSIRFTVPVRSDVTLTVHDALGRLIRTLHSGVIDAGTHTALLDGRDVPRGMLFCRLSAASSSSVILMHVRTY